MQHDDHKGQGPQAVRCFEISEGLDGTWTATPATGGVCRLMGPDELLAWGEAPSLSTLLCRGTYNDTEIQEYVGAITGGWPLCCI